MQYGTSCCSVRPVSQLPLELPRSREAIEPYARSTGGWTLVKADAAETLARFPDQCVDLIFADPPYFLSNGGTTCSAGERVSVDKGAWDASRGRAEDRAFHRRWLEQARLVLKPTGTIWVSGTHHVIFTIGDLMDELGFHRLNLVTWYKPNASPHLAGRYFCHSAEHLIWAAPRKYEPLQHVFNYRTMKAENGGKQLRDVWTFPTPSAREKKHGAHPTMKPLGLLDRIVRSSSDEGALVVDPFCGSGTTGVAAVKLGRRFIGIDLATEYLDLSRRRLEGVSSEAET